MHDLPEAISKRPRVAQVWPLLAVGLLGLAVAVAAWIAVSVWEERLARAKFNDVAGDYATVVQNGVDEDLDKIRALRAFFDASVEVDATEFDLFTKQILAGYGNAMRLVWSPHVSRSERATFVAAQRKRGEPDYSIKTWVAQAPRAISTERDEYYPVLYSTAAFKRTGTVGTDLNSEPNRSSAIRRARDGNVMTIAQDVVLLNPFDENRMGFIAFLPVYRQGVPHDTIIERRRNITGVLAGVFRTAKVLDTILDKATLPRNVDQRWSRLSEQSFRVDKWSVCQG